MSLKIVVVFSLFLVASAYPARRPQWDNYGMPNLAGMMFEEIPQPDEMKLMQDMMPTAGEMIPLGQTPENEPGSGIKENRLPTGTSSRGRPRAPFNAYFPVIFGGFDGSQGRKRSEEDYQSGTPIAAIANSVSNGERSVSSSHAVAYGGQPQNPQYQTRRPQQPTYGKPSSSQYTNY